MNNKETNQLNLTLLTVNIIKQLYNFNHFLRSMDTPKIIITFYIAFWIDTYFIRFNYKFHFINKNAWIISNQFL